MQIKSLHSYLQPIWQPEDAEAREEFHRLANEAKEIIWSTVRMNKSRNFITKRGAALMPKEKLKLLISNSVCFTYLWYLIVVFLMKNQPSAMIAAAVLFVN